MTIGSNKQLNLGDEIRQTNIEQAITSYEQARTDGLCHEGALEVAISALKGQEIELLVARLEKKMAK